MTPEKIARINELTKKKKTEGLTPEEEVEQAKLREEYIEGYRRSVRHHIEGIKVVDEEGNDVTPEKIARINELAKKKKTEGLTPEEAVEQAKLREEYIEGYRRSVRHHIEGIKVVDEEGNDVTPEKLRQIQREKGLHGRSLDDPES